MGENIKYTPLNFLSNLYKGKEEKILGIDELKKNNFTLDFSVVKSLGNNSYIPVELWWVEPKEVSEGILYILHSFEKERNLEIISWFIEKTFDNPRTNMKTYIDGIWITHRPKSK